MAKGSLTKQEFDDDDIIHVAENVDKKGIFYSIRKLPEKLKSKYKAAYKRKHDWWEFDETDLKTFKKVVKKKGFKVKVARLSQTVMTLDDALKASTEDKIPRLRTKFPQFDELLNGGFAKGSVTIFGGDTGAGKSTLANQCVLKWAQRGKRCVYVNSEETQSQVIDRFKRLNERKPFTKRQRKNIIILVLEDVDLVRTHLKNETADVIILDSWGGFQPRGSIKTLRAAADVIHQYVKWNNPKCVAIAMSHVTKDNKLAGPKSLQHMVDAILFLQGNSRVRTIQPIKNRFGSTAGMLQVAMEEEGFVFEDAQAAERDIAANRTLAAPAGQSWEEM